MQYGRNEFDRPASYYMNLGVDGQPNPSVTQKTGLLGFDPSTKNRPMLMPVREDGDWTAPSWFHSIFGKLPAGMLSLAKDEPFSVSAGELAEGGLDFAGMGGGTTMARGGTPSNVMGTIGGGGGFGRDKEALKQAKKMTADKSPYDIWRNTGWFKDSDGQWKFEMSDEAVRMRLKPEALYKEVPYFKKNAVLDPASPESILGTIHPDAPRLSDIVHAPDMFGNYPNLANAQILRGAEGGPHRMASFTPPSGNNPFGTFILGKTRSEEAPLLSTLLHESQHGIQHLEPDFGKPWSEKAFTFNTPTDIVQNDIANQMTQRWIQYLDVTHGSKNSNFDNFWNSMDADSLDYLRHVGMGNKSDAKTYFQHTLGIAPDASKTDLSRWKRNAGKDQRDILRYREWAENPEGSYFLSKGEVEARNVQQRAMLSPEERKVMSPWSTEGDFRRAGKLFGMSDSPKQEGISQLNFPRELAIHTPPKFPYLNQRLGILGDR